MDETNVMKDILRNGWRNSSYDSKQKKLMIEKYLENAMVKGAVKEKCDLETAVSKVLDIRKYKKRINYRNIMYNPQHDIQMRKKPQYDEEMKDSGFLDKSSKFEVTSSSISDFSLPSPPNLSNMISPKIKDFDVTINSTIDYELPPSPGMPEIIETEVYFDDDVEEFDHKRRSEAVRKPVIAPKPVKMIGSKLLTNRPIGQTIHNFTFDEALSNFLSCEKTGDFNLPELASSVKFLKEQTWSKNKNKRLKNLNTNKQAIMITKNEQFWKILANFVKNVRAQEVSNYQLVEDVFHLVLNLSRTEQKHAQIMIDKNNNIVELLFELLIDEDFKFDLRYLIWLVFRELLSYNKIKRDIFETVENFFKEFLQITQKLIETTRKNQTTIADMELIQTMKSDTVFMVKEISVIDLLDESDLKCLIGFLQKVDFHVVHNEQLYAHVVTTCFNGKMRNRNWRIWTSGKGFRFLNEFTDIFQRDDVLNYKNKTKIMKNAIELIRNVEDEKKDLEKHQKVQCFNDLEFKKAYCQKIQDDLVELLLDWIRCGHKHLIHLLKDF